MSIHDIILKLNMLNDTDRSRSYVSRPAVPDKQNSKDKIEQKDKDINAKQDSNSM